MNHQPCAFLPIGTKSKSRASRWVKLVRLVRLGFMSLVDQNCRLAELSEWYMTLASFLNVV